MAQQYYVKHASNQLPVTKDCPCEFCVTPRLDALGRVVPEWAREAFDILAKDGRRVAVGGWPNGGAPTDSMIEGHAVSILGTVGSGYGPLTIVAAWMPEPPRTLAAAARRALAMEAERKAAQEICPVMGCSPESPCARVSCPSRSTAGPKVRGITYPGQPTLAIDFASLSETQQDALVNLAAGVGALIEERYDDAAVALAEAQRLARRHNATCAKCHGPAFHGWGYAPTCEREGGCLADREPVVTRDDDTERTWIASSPRGLMFYEAHRHPTREGAVTAWREAVLERAKREAGK